MVFRKSATPTVADIKSAVRERDGLRCTGCGVSNEEHVELSGRQLDVHRITPGSPYTVEGCVTLCRKCHGPMPRSPRRLLFKRQQVNFRLPSGLLADLEYIGETLGNDVSSVIRTILTENVSRYLMQAHEVRERREESAKAKGKSKPKGKE